MESMKNFKTFEAWVAAHVRLGDGEKFRKEWDKLHGVKPKRKAAPKAKAEPEKKAAPKKRATRRRRSE